MRESESWVFEDINKMDVARWKAQLVHAGVPLEERAEDEEVEEVCARQVITRGFA